VEAYVVRNLVHFARRVVEGTGYVEWLVLRSEGAAGFHQPVRDRGNGAYER
jgi:hypothetical protein